MFAGKLAEAPLDKGLEYLDKDELATYTWACGWNLLSSPYSTRIQELSSPQAHPQNLYFQKL